jgi:membrane protease YdiL (CAAX protease family)
MIVIGVSIFALMGHGARKKRWLEWLVRGIIAFCCFGEGHYIVYGLTDADRQHSFYYNILVSMCACSTLSLFYIFRLSLSYILTGVQDVVSLHFFASLIKKIKDKSTRITAERVFVPSSIPHMVGLFVYISAFSYLLSGMHPGEFDLPGLPIPIPIQLDQLIAYNLFGLVLLAFCGVGIYVSRKPRECMKRLGLVKPTMAQVGIGVGLIFFSFLYEALWSFFTHSAGGDLASKLAMYNSGTFAGGEGLTGAIIKAFATAICAGIGEETLMRGALQPALGILPAAVLHGALHGQFAHTPIFIVQVAVWSAIVGIVRHYTNTTTTIIAHSGFNLLTTFLFAFNP